MLEELELTADQIRELARHPAGDELPIAGDHCQLFEDDWQGAAKAALIDGSATSAGRRCAFSGVPLVPDYVRRFIGFRDVQDPGRAVTLFRCAAVLAEAGTPAPVIFGLLEEPALKTGLDPAEVQKQLRGGIEHGRRILKEVAT